MRWRKLGRIFDPRTHKLPGGCVDFAQAPQALVFDELIRVYFSTRAVDEENGKFRSHIAFVDMRKDFSAALRVSSHTVIPLGGLGCFDEHGIFPMTVTRVGREIYGYTCGWNRRVSVSVDTAVGLAISRDDGLTFRRIGAGPVLAATLREPFLVGDGSVSIIGGVFHIWYIFGTSWKRYCLEAEPDRTYKIGHAVSSDGVSWSKEEGRQIIPSRLGEDESQAMPSVVEIDGRYHMFFCYRHSFNFRHDRDRGYRIGHAYSDDLVNWVRDDDDPLLDVSPTGWDADMVCYPSVVVSGTDIYLLYNGNEFGRFGFGAAVLEK